MRSNEVKLGQMRPNKVNIQISETRSNKVKCTKSIKLGQIKLNYVK